MKRSLAIIFFAVLVQWASAQNTWNPDMNFNVSFSPLNGESSNLVWWGLCGYNRSIRVPLYIPNAPIYTNNLEVNILFATLPDSMWILEKEANRTFKTITKITNGINGDNYNFVDQRFTLTKNQVQSLIKGNWYLEADYADNMIISHLEPQYDTAHGPTAVIEFVSPIFQRPFPGIYVVIAKDNQKADVVLDGSHSTDCFYLPMQFSWSAYHYGNMISTNRGATVTHAFRLGEYYVDLCANDSIARGKISNINLTVIKASQAVGQIVPAISYLSVPDIQVKKLNEILSRASKNFDEGKMAMGCYDLFIFIRQVQASHSHNEAASWTLQASQRIIESLGFHCNL